MNKTELIEAAKRGERIHPPLSLHTEEKRDPDCSHRWREIACNSDEDVVECSKCGRQRVARCTFNDDFA